MTTLFSPQAARDWLVLPPADLAMLRFSLLCEMARFERDGLPALWWWKDYQQLLAVKVATALEAPHE